MSAPLLLALETASPVSSVALFEGKQLVACYENHQGRQHARIITLLIEHLLSDNQLKVADLSAVAVAKGPGSYTGLRVGVSTAKGLAMAADLPLLSVSSLEALAWRTLLLAEARQARICPMIDARRMEVYTQAYGVQEGRIQALGEAEAKIIDENSYQAELEAGMLIFLGSGAAKCRPVLDQHPNALFLDDLLSTASSMGPALFHKYEQGETENLTTFEPFYLKDFVATKQKKLL